MKAEATIVLTALGGLAAVLLGVQKLDQMEQQRRRERALALEAPKIAAAIVQTGLEFRPAMDASCDGRGGEAGTNPVSVPVLLKAKMGYCADFHGADLAGAELQRASLGSADLRGADLRGADLFEADLMGADLTGADLTGANLIHARWDARTRLPFSAAEAQRRGMRRADQAEIALRGPMFELGGPKT